MEVFEVLDPGPFTTVQDLGRYGYQSFGVPVSGALDTYSARVANILLGNAEDLAVLEITFMGPRLKVLCEAEVVITGAEVPLLLNGEPRRTWEVFRIRPGDILSMKPAVAGLRAYLGVTGGIDVPVVMGSRSTYAGAKLGGLNGRPLARGDVLRMGGGELGRDGTSVPEAYRPSLEKRWVLRAIPGPQDDLFDQGLEVFFGSVYKVTSKTDRMGCRLAGPQVPLREGAPKSIISEPSLAGAVQIPPDGQPIILLVEQTVGGYAKIATVISADLHKVAQARPDHEIRFRKVDISEGHAAYREMEDRLTALRAELQGEG